MAIAGTMFAGCSDDAEMPANPDRPVAVKEATNDIIYEVNPRFYGSENCLAKVNASLDAIRNTGANILWVMPVNDPGVLNSIGSPYCVKDFKGINARYGTMADFKSLVDNAHGKGMKVILDWVANHTAWDCPWIVDHKDWYTQDSDGNIVSPSGWTDVAELNYDNADMRAEMLSSMSYWIDNTGIDGFRFDHVEGVPVDFWIDAIAKLRAAHPDLIMLAETSDLEYFAADFDINYGWNFGTNLTKLFNASLTPANFFSESQRDIAALPTGKKAMRYAVNHDVAAESSISSLYGSEKGVEAAYVLAMMLDGIPMIYSSQEIDDYSGTVSFFDYGAKTFNADKNAWYAKMADIYKVTQPHRCGELRTYQSGKAAMFARAVGDSRLLVIVNPTASAISVKTPIDIAGQVVVDAFSNQQISLPVSITLDGYGYAIYYTPGDVL